MQVYFYTKLREYLDLYIRPDDRIVEIDAKGAAGRLKFENHLVLTATARAERGTDLSAIKEFHPDYVLLNCNIHYETDIQNFLEDLRKALTPAARIIIAFYSNLWRPLLRMATALGLRSETPEANWIAPEDLQNLPPSRDTSLSARRVN